MFDDITHLNSFELSSEIFLEAAKVNLSSASVRIVSVSRDPISPGIILNG